ncbi:hypothetical protein [Paenibacillus pabuli]|uniref:hypothetical protein n=1 Tax=Paenibacillus pabuli TaxID=1472 RepID=UPI001FFEE724|nr:hypothetical protein [Paenibacillus pabuli]
MRRSKDLSQFIQCDYKIISGLHATGVILATCELSNCYQVIDANHASAILDCGKVVTGEDLLLGDYSPGYFAWEIAGFRLLKPYIPVKGKLGLWEYPLDEELLI